MVIRSHEYFVDGVVEDIITGLARARWLFVIARNSSFVYKRRACDVRQVGRDLGVRYVLDGSIRKAGERVRIAVQLLDGTSGNQVWARRYDRELSDIFALQDEITETILGAVEPELGKLERKRATTKRPDSVDAWDLYQRGMSHLYQYTKKDLALARQFFRQATERDLRLGPAYSGLAEAYYYEGVYGFADSISECRENALAPALRAVELDREDAGARCTLGRAHYMRRNYEAAVRELRTALQLNPSLALAHYGLGAALVFSGRSQEAVSHLTTAIRLSPYDPNMGSFLVRLADAAFFAGKYEEAAEWAQKALQQPNFQWSRYTVLIAALAQLGRLEEANRFLQQLKVERPDISLSFVRETHLFGDADDFAHYLGALRKAGVADVAGAAGGAPAAADAALPEQEIRFCRAADDVRIAYSVVGQGPPLVKAAHWLSHLEYDWQSPIWRPLLQALAAEHRLVRYDERGNGLSEWDVEEISFEAFVCDLESVVDASGLERFPLFGMSQGCAVSIAYAVRHPERITHLVLLGGYARGRRKRGSKKDMDEADALRTLMHLGWGQENPAFRQVFTSLFIPDGSPEQMQWLNDLQRNTTSPENAVRIREAMNSIDVTDLLPHVSVPTLVFHCRHDAMTPFEEGRILAAGIPGARFVALEGRNHLMLKDEPAWAHFLDEVRAFLRTPQGCASPAAGC